MMRKAETQAECAKWATFLGRFQTQARIYLDRYTILHDVWPHRREKVENKLRELATEAKFHETWHYDELYEAIVLTRPALREFQAPSSEINEVCCKLCFDRFQVIKNFRKMKDFYKCNVSERCYKVIKRDKHGRVIKVIRRLRMKGCKMSP